MNNDSVERTQIYLGEEEVKLPDRAGRATGASRSELIRRAIRSTFGEWSAADRRQALLASAGALGSRTESGAEYVDRIRGDLNRRLADGGSDLG